MIFHSSPTGCLQEPELTVVIPAFNEGTRLGSSLDRTIGYLKASGRSFEVLVVDDGSRDATAGVATSYSARGVKVLRHHENQGKGAAVRTGVRASRGNLVLISDADLSTPIEELVRHSSLVTHTLRQDHSARTLVVVLEGTCRCVSVWLGSG